VPRREGRRLSGAPVLAIHGIGGGAYFFGDLGTRLAPACQLTTVELHALGPHSSSDSFTIETWVDDLSELIRRSIGAPVAVIGHSLGTILALKLWAAAPSFVRAIVCVGGLPEVRDAIRERLTPRIDLVRREGLRGWGARVAAGVFSPATMRDRPEIVRDFERRFEQQDAHAYARQIEQLLGASAVSIVPRVHVPVLCLTGADDQYAPPEYVTAFAAHFCHPPEVAVIPDCGHQPFLEAPDASARIVREFLSA